MTEEFNEPETIVNRLRGIYDTGPAGNPNEFRREFPGRPAINYEAARRIEALEQEVERIREAYYKLIEAIDNHYPDSSEFAELYCDSKALLNHKQGE